jgi:hypothetical protein
LIEMRGRLSTSLESMMTLVEKPVRFVDPLFHRDGFDDVAELDHAGDFREDRDRVRIPLGEQVAGLYLRTVLFLELGTDRRPVARSRSRSRPFSPSG